MKNNKKFIVILCISILINIFTIININKLNESNTFFKTKLENIIISSNMEYIDYVSVNNSHHSLIDAVYLYQYKDDVTKHGLMVIVNGKSYNLGIAPDIQENLQNNSKINSIKDNIVEYDLVFVNQSFRQKLTITPDNENIHYKLETIN